MRKSRGLKEGDYKERTVRRVLKTKQKKIHLWGEEEVHRGEREKEKQMKNSAGISRPPKRLSYYKIATASILSYLLICKMLTMNISEKCQMIWYLTCFPTITKELYE